MLTTYTRIGAQSRYPIVYDIRAQCPLQLRRLTHHIRKLDMLERICIPVHVRTLMA